jgi:hypothetical protein
MLLDLLRIFYIVRLTESYIYFCIAFSCFSNINILHFSLGKELTFIIYNIKGRKWITGKLYVFVGYLYNTSFYYLHLKQVLWYLITMLNVLHLLQQTKEKSLITVLKLFDIQINTNQNQIWCGEFISLPTIFFYS